MGTIKVANGMRRMVDGDQQMAIPLEPRFSVFAHASELLPSLLQQPRDDTRKEKLIDGDSRHDPVDDQGDAGWDNDPDAADPCLGACNRLDR